MGCRRGLRLQARGDGSIAWRRHYKEDIGRGRGGGGGGGGGRSSET
jgi:hypothetical protein